MESGLLGRIKHSDCPFCKLVVRAVQAFHQTQSAWFQLEPVSTNNDMELQWFSAIGPGGRGAFTIDPALQQVFICASSKLKPSLDSVSPSSIHVRPTIEAAFDVDRLSQWISTCTQTHHDTCTVEVAGFEQAFPGLEVLRFIDTEKESIVSLRSIPKYVALSYVWGQAASATLTTTNKDVLQRTGGLQKAWHMIPLTVKDAIDLVRRLGARYLWVDALCLVQNDAADLSRGVQVMDAIYERSWLTIVAASGHDANAGLPGIQDRSRFATYPTKITNELYMDIFVPLDRLLKRSVYSSRAWTERIYSEHVFDQPSPSGDYLFNWASMLQITAAMETPLTDFEIMLLYYTPRALTDQNDVLRALTGIIRRVSERARCQFLQGIPTAAFDAFLTFQAHNGLTRRRRGFPSYSWTGWKGGICIDYSHSMFQDVSRWLEEETWIIWYKRSPSGIVSLVWDPAASDSFPPDDRTYAGYRQRRRFQPPQTSTGPLIASTRTYPTEHLPSELSPFPYPILQFWSLSVYFKLCPDDIFMGSAFIINRSGMRIGTITLDGLDAGTFFNWQTVFEFALLSGVAISEARDKTPKYWVMLLEWKDQVAESRGMGKIERDFLYSGWAPGPVWKEFILG
ncbi:hypothetical protein TrVFT333_008112 [Trichoderma virens FT-333]|nr:hypothetical protein TrVFT333_008112 [Trichoderma virens FT-333]